MIKLSECIGPAFYGLHHSVKRDEYTHYWLKGGRSSAKSSFVSIEIVKGLEEDADANAIVYRQVGNTLADSVVTQILWAINLLGLNYEWKLQKSPYKFINKRTKQQIMFRGNDDAEKSKGVKLASGYFRYIWFEEVTEFKGMEDIDTILRSLIRGQGHANVFYTYNPPKNVSNWVNVECKITKPNKVVHHSTYLDLPAAWLGEQFIEDAELLKKNNDLQYRWAYLGEEIGIGGLILTNWEEREADQDLRHYDCVYIGQDFGFNHCNVLLLLGFKDGNIYVLKEQVNRGLDTGEIIEQCEMPKDILMYCDSAEPDRIKTWQQSGFNAHPVSKEQNSIKAQIDYLVGRRIYIDPSCSQTKKEILQWSWKHDDRLDIWLDEPVPFMDDAMAALRYGIEAVRKPYGVQVVDVYM